MRGISNRLEHSQTKVIGWHQQYGNSLEWYTTLKWADPLQKKGLLDVGTSKYLMFDDALTEEKKGFVLTMNPVYPCPRPGQYRRDDRRS